jgi:hypothetical protein
MSVEFAVLCLGLGAVAIVVAALVDAMARGRRLHRQRALSDLAELGRQEFEEVIADAFRRHGYRVREVGGRGDGEWTWSSSAMARPRSCK